MALTFQQLINLVSGSSLCVGTDYTPAPNPDDIQVLKNVLIDTHGFDKGYGRKKLGTRLGVFNTRGSKDLKNYTGSVNFFKP